MKLKPVKKLGSSKYFISYDKKFFYKKTRKNLIKKEYNNLKKLESFEINNLKFLKPIGIQDNYLVTEYVDANSLVYIRNSKVYKKFGKVLKLFHKQGYSHSHLQINDILYKDNNFILTDLVDLNEKDAIYDIAIFKLSIVLFIIKKPYYWYSYAKCYNSFKKGYNLQNKLKLYNAFEEIIDVRITNFMKRTSLKSVFVVFLLKLIKRVITIRAKN